MGKYSDDFLGVVKSLVKKGMRNAEICEYLNAEGYERLDGNAFRPMDVSNIKRTLGKKNVRARKIPEQEAYPDVQIDNRLSTTYHILATDMPDNEKTMVMEAIWKK